MLQLPQVFEKFIISGVENEQENEQEINQNGWRKDCGSNDAEAPRDQTRSSTGIGSKFLGKWTDLAFVKP